MIKVTKKIVEYLRGNFFSEHFTLEYRTCMIYYLISFGVSVLALVSRLYIQTGLFATLLPACYLCVCVIMLVIPVNLRTLIAKTYVDLTVLLYIPCFFFQTTDLSDATLVYGLLGIFIMVIIHSGKARVPMTAASLVIYVGCIVIRHVYLPQDASPVSSGVQLFDMVVAMSLAVIGFAAVMHYILDAFTREQNRIQTLYNQLERSNMQLEQLSQRDALTGIYNRRYLTEFLDRTLESCKLSGRHIYFLMMDVDLFKHINDTYGHGFGDEVLVATATIVSSMLRKSDALVRFGGEEFAAVLYGTNDQKAVEIAERICKSVRSLQFRHEVQVTISIGLVRSMLDEPQIALIERADQELYRAKREGRNRVCHRY